MTDIQKFQQWASDEYADAMGRRDGPDREALLDYIDFNQVWGAKCAAAARKLMGIADADQFYA